MTAAKPRIPINQLAVIWQHDGRLGSIRQDQIPALQAHFHMQLFQTDISGCQHWNVIGQKPICQRALRGGK
jgi:hypothetical protein